MSESDIIIPVRTTDEHAAARRPHAYRAYRAVPRELQVRKRIRDFAKAIARRLPTDHAPALRTLEDLARDVLDQAHTPPGFLAFAVVAVSNAFWRTRFAAIPFRRRLLLLPHCMRHSTKCPGTYDKARFFCANCGRCNLGVLTAEARQLGYQVLTAEGTPPVLSVLRSGECDAVLGVACLDSLEHTFRHVSASGVPAMAIPLLTDGCRDTTVEVSLVRDFLSLTGDRSVTFPPSYLPLWRTVDNLFQEPAFTELVTPAGAGTAVPESDPTERMAITWLRDGGKRFRPFMTLGVYAALQSENADDSNEIEANNFPGFAQRLAIAMEAMHKASLAHDDIADDDVYRYGRPTLHRQFGIPAALNAGDHLIGIGYRLVLSTASELGARSVNQFLTHLTETHQALCRGQGQELGLTGPMAPAPRPMDVLTIYARKTATAFAISLEAGAFAAGFGNRFYGDFRRFSRVLGAAYQIQNDLDDWQNLNHNKRLAGQDAFRRRPTILRAFALERGALEREAELLERIGTGRPPQTEKALGELRAFYRDSGAFSRAEALQLKLSKQAHEAASGVAHAGLQRFLRFMVELLFGAGEAG